MSIPKGYKLVPVEPTEEMQIAGGRDQGFCSTCRYDNGGGDPASTYTCMLAAAPAPQQPIYDEAKERKTFAEVMVALGRCNHVNAVLDDDDFYHFKSEWELWKACAQSRAKAGEDE